MEWIEPSPVAPLSGDEPFTGVGAHVRDFWRWALSDLRMNTNRPMLAEFLVARAVGDARPFRIEWANFDVLSPEGIRIEVKSSGYCQSWRQAKLSTINFGRFRARSWDPELAVYSEEPALRADVYVFAVQVCMDCAQYDALNVDQWEFYVLPARVIEEHGGKSIGLAFVRSRAEPVHWEKLADEIRSKAESRSA